MTPTYIIVHHTATPRDTTTVTAVNEYHRTKNWGTAAKPAYALKSTLGYYLGYHYFIDGKGVLTQCADDSELRWHAGSMNDKAIGVCLAGWFDAGHDSAPSEVQVKTLTELLKKLSVKHSIPAERVVPHRKFANKTCYGLNLADDWAAKLVTSVPVVSHYDIGTPFPVYKKIGTSTLYVRAGSTLIRIATDFQTYLAEVGNARIIELSEADFQAFRVSQEIAIMRRF